MKSAVELLLAASICGIALGTASSASAQTEASAQEEAREDDGMQRSNDIVVQAQIVYRDRSEATEPTLVYDSDFFQRFEPLTAGDALKRVPSVTFLSDVIESDGARLRGLDPGYTQILINGDKVPGTNADRSFFLDRIPAELISRVEIVRSSSARRTGDAIAGTLNIVLRDGYQLDGGYVRAGALRFDDGEVKPSVGAVYGGQVGPGRLLLGANIQGRYNPKLKESLRFGDSPENRADFEATFVNREDQTDTRDGTDTAVNLSYSVETDATEIALSGFYVNTDRTETERSFEYDSRTAVNGSVRGTPAGNLLTDNANVNDIDTVNYSLGLKVKQDWSLGETTLKGGFARFFDKQFETEYEIDFDRATPRFTGDLTVTDNFDEEMFVSLDHEFKLADHMDLVIGGFLQNKNHDTDIREGLRDRRNLTAAFHFWNQFESNPTQAAQPFLIVDPVPGGVNRIEEDRRDAFALVEGNTGGVAWEAGLRYENTSVRISDMTVAPALAVTTLDYGILLPSASVKIDVTPVDRITISGARTNRRPRLDYLSPAVLEEELGDNDLVGNPNLRPETAWGFDIGYERRIGHTGVAGINFFYRDVTDLVEIASTGQTGSAGGTARVLQPRNTGNGRVYGVEFDLSTDLRFIGLADTGIFGNFSYLESEITDFAGERRFNGQSKYVFNVGLIQNIPSVGAAFGATYRKQGAAFDRQVAEEVTTTYGAGLEVFVEKRFGRNFTIRAVGSNLLDGPKEEAFNKFADSADQASRTFDEYELESETAGPVFQVMARLAF